MPLRRSTVRGREFGDAMRALLRAAGLTNRAVAELLGWDEGKVSDLINGKGGSDEVDLATLLGLLRATPEERAHLLKLFRETEQKDWLQPASRAIPDRARTLREHEKIASRITSWSMTVVHGLLQVPDYAWHMGKSSLKVSDQDLGEFVRNRITRQKAVLDGRRPVTIYMHENALRLPVGNPSIMAEQRHYLLQMAVRDFLTLRVVPTAIGAHAALAGDFDLLKFDKLQPIVYLESEGANIFLEDQPSVGLYDAVVKSLDRTAFDAAQTRKLIISVIDEEASHDQVAEE